MKYYIIRYGAQCALLFLMACVVCVSCTVDDSDLNYQQSGFMSDDMKLIGHLGTYEGIWTLDGEEAGTGVMSVYKDSISFDTLPQETIARRCTGNIIEDMAFEPVRYCVKYFLNGNSANTYYFTLEIKNYQFNMKSADWNFSVSVAMTTISSDLPNAIYNNGSLVAMLKISRIVAHTADGKTVVNDFEPAMLLMFNPVKRIK